LTQEFESFKIQFKNYELDTTRIKNTATFSFPLVLRFFFISLSPHTPNSALKLTYRPSLATHVVPMISLWLVVSFRAPLPHSPLYYWRRRNMSYHELPVASNDVPGICCAYWVVRCELTD